MFFCTTYFTYMTVPMVGGNQAEAGVGSPPFTGSQHELELNLYMRNY